LVTPCCIRFSCIRLPSGCEAPEWKRCRFLNFAILPFLGTAKFVSIQGKGVGSALLKDALIRTAQAADTIGARALLVHAKDDEAKAFYQHFTFEPSPSDPYHLLLIMKDLLQMVAG